MSSPSISVGVNMVRNWKCDNCQRTVRMDRDDARYVKCHNCGDKMYHDGNGLADAVGVAIAITLLGSGG